MKYSKKLLALLSLLGISYGQTPPKEINPMKARLYSEVQSMDTATCQSNIVMNKKYIYNGQGNNYVNYINQSGWTDSDFNHGDTCFAWPGYTTGKLSTSTTSAYTWQRAMSTSYLSNQAIYYHNTEYNDIAQGGLGDCYLMASIASVAEQPLRLRQAILTDTINTGGIFAMEVYTRGIPHVMYIDDYIPFSGSSPVFAAQSNDGSLYVMLVEKMWAKVNVNYERTNGGTSDEFFDFVGGIPTDSWSNSADPIKSNPDLVLSYINDARSKGYVIAGGVGSCGSSGDSDRNAIGMACGHAYSILGTANLNGVNLIKMRNPWSQDTYTGAYSDYNLTDAQAAALGTQRNNGDGVFFISQAEFVKYVGSFYIGYFVNDDYNNYLDVTNSVNNTMATYSFTIPSSGNYSVGVQFYPARMYPYGCKTGTTQALVKLSDSSNNILNYAWAVDWDGMNTYRAVLGAGTYTMQVTPKWQAVDVQEYTVRVVGPSQVSITGGSSASQSRQLLHIDDSTASQTFNTTNEDWVLPPASSTVTLDACGTALVTDLASWVSHYTTWGSTVQSNGVNAFALNAAWVKSPTACKTASYYSYYYSVGSISNGALKLFMYFTVSSSSEIVSNTGYACQYNAGSYKCYCDLTVQSNCSWEMTTPGNSISYYNSIVL